MCGHRVDKEKKEKDEYKETCGDDLKVGVIRCKDRTDVTRFCKFVKCVQIGFRVHLINIKIVLYHAGFS